MTQNFEPAFISRTPPEPSGGLLEKILTRIREERRRLPIKQRLAFFSVGLAVSSIALLPAFKLVQAGFEESGFNQFLSLLASDGAMMAVYWKNFLFTLLESAPVMSMFVFLFVVWIFLQSLKFLARDIKQIYQLSN